MKKLAPKHPLAVRWFHWLNFPLLALMVWSGILIYWANPIYRIGWGGHTLLYMRLTPRLYQLLHISSRLAQGMAWHFFVMWLFAVNGVLYVGYTLISGEWRYLVPNKSSFREAWQVMLHDLHLRKELPPQGRFNGAQKIAYTMVVLMGLGSLLTGLAIYKPIQVNWLTAAFGGYAMARFLHFWLTMGYIAFFLVHVAQVVKAGWNNFRAMVIGVEVVEEPAPAPKVEEAA
ncbi:MAG TPA: cytochrome b/b6 domain-containing protein [Thermoanaerobaculia bacterium]|jgi:thiosulfate reductase cytochrome b subunit|nr:cytochrome b/b6 domain-containing protein [Thermoanaerobaculia bacterium]